MNRRTLAICDPEEAYACRLMDALSRREDFPFEVLAFTGAERLQDSLARKPVQILLIAQGLFREEMKDWVRHVILLQEEENSPVQELPCVSKYSSVLRIAKKLTETVMQTEKLPFLQTVGKACVYGFYTPVGRSLQTTLALTMGQLLAANKRVLYLNFECCAGLTEMLGKQADNTEFASLLYYLQESKEQFLGRLYQAAWPEFEEEKTVESVVEIGVQVNGKMRVTINVSKDETKENVIAMAKEALGDKLTGNIVKEIYVPGRIVNIVAK